ncbi:related to component of the spindle assembly checkpoint dma1 [Sporisorium reilianum SRZ2]|uniref:Related to component of the spindle assembly checkpoint dma1 n=1 Tax=Sporisorium reilianum (strain SRZ2) TaxID=999809 RepID=E7A2P1_SPORE|nr:related to component of the spindle assembly checkpoint dma1 [Sporisorium reilianum SRZ2]
MTTANASSTQSGGGSGSALGRMFRRYSQSGSARAESQRPSTRDRDSFNMPRNTSSPALDREHSSPMRSSTNPAVASPSLLRSGSHGPADTSAAIAGSRTLASLASPASPAPAATTAAPAAAHAQASSEDAANTASRLNNTTIPETASTDAPSAAAGGSASPAPSRPLNGMHRIRLVPHLEAARSLHFEPIERDLKEGANAVKVGRFTDRQPSNREPVAATLAGGANEANSSGEFGSTSHVQSSRGQPGARGGAIPISGSHGGGGRIDSARIAFKSKVVSRGHAEIWCEPGGKFFIRDTKSSSGTFLNHIRLSGPNLESKPFAIKDGDVVQLGVDYQGGTEEIYRCVKMRVELNRGWQREANQFNVNAFRQLRALQGTPLSPPTTDDKGKAASAALPTNRQSVSVTDCCICLFSVTVCQALFIAPCSHVFHYKCIRPLLNLHHPGFSCPLCRTFADLDADVEEDEAWQEALMHEAAAAEARLAQGKLPLEVGTPAVELDAPISAGMPPTLTTVLLNGTASGGETASPTNAGNSNAVSSRSPLLADLQAGHAAPNGAVGRGTAALSRRKNDWARPDTAVGSSAGPFAGDETFAPADGAAESAGLSGELGEMVITDRLLNEGEAAGADSTALFHRAGHGASETGSPIRRGSGPIAIGGSERTLHAHRATPSSSSMAAPPILGSLEEGWPAVGAVGGFSPGLDESGTPLNSTFLSTLAEAPHAGATNTSSPSSARDFPPGRSAPAQTVVPALVPAGTSRVRLDESGAHEERARGETRGERAKRSSDGGEDVDTAEEEMGGPAVGSAFGHPGAAHAKGKAKLDAKPLTMAGDAAHDLALKVNTHTSPASASVGATKPSGVRGRSRSRSRGGREAVPSDSDDQEAAPFQPYEHPPVPRTGPNLSSSAYLSYQHHQQSPSNAGGGGRQVSGDRSGNTGEGASSPASPVSPASESKMARFKRRISHAM